MKTKLFLSTFLLFTIVMNGQGSYKFYGNFSYNSIVYEVKLLTDETNKSYKIQICKDDANCEESVSLSNVYNQDIFFNALTAVMNKPKLALIPIFDVNTNDIKTQWKGIYDKLMKEINKKEVLTELYDNQNIEYSGKINLHKEVVLKLKDTASTGDSQNKAKGKRKADSKKEDEPAKSLTFKAEYASVRFFNNRINTIAVVGILGNEKTSRTLTNNVFSIPFRYIINNGSTLEVEVYVDGKKLIYVLEWNDLLDYKPDGTEYNYSVKNKNYKLKPNEEVKVESRNLFDYFTAIVFTDFLGLNSEGNNSLLLAEGRVVIPMALVNKGRFNSPQYFEAYLTTSMYNGQEEGSGFVVWKDPTANDGVTEKINTFEFFKKRNIEAGLNLGLVSVEWRGLASTFTLDYGFQFYRSKLRYVKDSLNNNEDLQVYSIGHGPKLKIEIRPQVNFGADLNVGLMAFNYNGLNKSLGYNGDFEQDVLIKNKSLYNGLYVVSNFYTKLNDKETNNGLYFRLGVNYDFYSHDVAPQIMVGYATNLTSFINKFKKKEEVVIP
jgi:hypothetical protein